MNSRSGLLMRSSIALSASSTEVPSVISVVTRSNSVETGGWDFVATVSSARSIAYPVLSEFESSCSMPVSCSLNMFCRRRCRNLITSGGTTKPTIPRMTGPREMPKRKSPIRAPSATAPIRMSRYSAGVTFRPARARSSVRVGLPLALRRWLRFSAAGRSSLSTSSRGVALGGAGANGRAMRSLLIRSRLQKKTTIAAAIGTATMIAGGRFNAGIPSFGGGTPCLEEGWVRGLHDLKCHALGCRDRRARRIRSLGAGLKVVMKRLKDIFHRGVVEEPRDHLGLAFGHHHGQAARVRAAAAGRRSLRSDPDHVEVREDRLRRHLTRRGHGRDHRDVVLRLDVIGDALLLAGRDGHRHEARGDRQVLRL